MKHRVALLFASLFWALPAAPALFAADESVAVNIRYFDQRVYYAGNAPILVQVTITNNGPATYRFKLADERAFSVDFDVRTVSNRSVGDAEWLVRKRTANQHIYFRDVIVESGESFSFVEDIRNYANLTQSGAFVVQAKLHPALVRVPGTGNQEETAPLESNRLSLNLRPPAIPGPGGLPLAMDVETNAVLAREKLPPDEIIRYTLTARQKSQWEKFFLYLDLEALLTRDSARQRQWRAESEEGRRRMIARYRGELQSSVIDGDIAAIPSEFAVERTAYGVDTGEVTVLEKFKTGNYSERKRYTYYLRRKDDIWTIVDYTVLNLGTE
ncbi:MAG: hypothetical protein LBD37_09015 [Treponema sp.]|jgi:hypothetical protein|nr:hypothetical protein [Treponema sp.]